MTKLEKATRQPLLDEQFPADLSQAMVTQVEQFSTRNVLRKQARQATNEYVDEHADSNVDMSDVSDDAMVLADSSDDDSAETARTRSSTAAPKAQLIPVNPAPEAQLIPVNPVPNTSMAGK